MWFHDREIQRETKELNTILELTERKRIVFFCVAQRKNRKCDFSFTQDTQGR